MGKVGRRSSLLALLGWLGAGALAGRTLAQDVTAQRRWQLGVLPITSTRVLLRNYQLAQAHLERELRQPMELVTAADFRSFHEATIAGRYDLIVTASHFGRLAQLEAGYVPLARYRAMHRTLLLMARAHPVRSVEELRGRSIAGPDPLTLAAMETEAWLRVRGLRAGQDYTVVETPTPASAAVAVLSQKSLLAVSTPQGLKNTAEAQREQLEVFASLPEIPSLMWLAHPRLTPQTERIKSALLAFTDETTEGRVFFEATGYIGLRAVQSAELKATEAYMPRLREALKSAK